MDAPEPGQLSASTLVGAGAVGQAMLWACAAARLHFPSQMDIVDPQSLDETNLNRHMVSGWTDVGRPKAEIAGKFIRPFAEQAHPFAEDFDTYRRQKPRADVVISTVDNDEARYQVQGSLPRWVLHAATERERLSAAVLDIARDACLGCLFPRREQDLAQTIAEQTGIRLADVTFALETDGVATEAMIAPLAERLGENPSELRHMIGRNFREVYAREICGRLGPSLSPSSPAPTIAYVSGFAGVLLAAELAKISSSQLNRWQLSNYVQLAALHPEAAWVARRRKEPDCPLMCSSPALQRFVAEQRSSPAAMR
jgi:molybdopterin/thiamine biosynthesis adenylyltransferase